MRFLAGLLIVVVIIIRQDTVSERNKNLMVSVKGGEKHTTINEEKREQPTPKKHLLTYEEKMKQQKMKKLILTFAISLVIILGIVTLICIWCDVDKDVIRKTLATYIVSWVAYLLVEQTPLAYQTLSKTYPTASNFGVLMAMVSIACLTVLTYILIWGNHENVVVWKLMASVAVVNFVFYLSVLALNKWGPESEETQEMNEVKNHIQHAHHEIHTHNIEGHQHNIHHE